MVRTVKQCQVHPTHHDRLIDVVLDGGFPNLPDAATIPEHLALSFPMLVWDWERYQPDGYCPAKSEVSKSLLLQGVWESYETVLTLDILREPGLVIDIGAGFGWYTLLATQTGHAVISVESDFENIRLLNLNLTMNDVGAEIHPIWIDALTPRLGVDDPVRLIKIDVEGAEDQAVRVCEPLTADYLLVEISPILAGHYPKTVQTICGYGYRPFLIPHGDPGFGADPLGQIQDHPLTNLDFDQADVLFIKEELCAPS